KNLGVMEHLGAFPGGAEAFALEGWRFAVAAGVSFLLGALICIGIGHYAPLMIMLALLGMHPLAPCPILMPRDWIRQRLASHRPATAQLPCHPTRAVPTEPCRWAAGGEGRSGAREGCTARGPAQCAGSPACAGPATLNAAATSSPSTRLASSDPATAQGLTLMMLPRRRLPGAYETPAGGHPSAPPGPDPSSSPTDSSRESGPAPWSACGRINPAGRAATGGRVT